MTCKTEDKLALVTTVATRRAKLQSSRHQKQINIHFFTGQMPFLSPIQQCQSTAGKNITFHGLAYPKLTWDLPTLSWTTNSSWLPWGRVAMPLISSLIPVPHINVMPVVSKLPNKTSVFWWLEKDCTDLINKDVCEVSWEKVHGVEHARSRTGTDYHSFASCWSQVSSIKAAVRPDTVRYTLTTAISLHCNML